MGDKLKETPSPTIGVAEYARIVGLSRPTVYSYIKEGLIKPIKHTVTKRGATRYVLSRAEAESIRDELQNPLANA